MTEKQASPVLTVDTLGHPGTRHYVGIAPMRTTKTHDERKSDTASRVWAALSILVIQAPCQPQNRALRRMRR